jgi:hypothetical protein
MPDRIVRGDRKSRDRMSNMARGNGTDQCYLCMGDMRAMHGRHVAVQQRPPSMLHCSESSSGADYHLSYHTL